MPNGKETDWWKLLGQIFPPVAPFSPSWEWPWTQPAQAAPAPPAQLTWKAGQALKGMDYPLPPEIQFPEPTPAERYEAWQKAQEVDLTGGIGKPPVTWRTITEGGWDYSVGYDEDGREVMRNPLGRTEERGMTEAQKRAAELAQAKFEWEKTQAGLPPPISPYQQQQFGLQQQQYAQQLAQQQQQYALQQQQFGLQEQRFAEEQAQFQQQLEFQQAQAQAAQEEQEQRYRAQLAAQPINWLQYAAYTGEEPVVQPWMVPLGFQNVGGTMTPQGQLQPGQPIPGFQAGQTGQQGIQTFANLPQLRTPSAQLQARWGPTAQEQFLGYRQARTGATPEETQFRLGAGRAPTGRFGGFSRFR